MEFRLENEKDFLEVENLTREAFWDVYRPGCNEHLVLHKLRNAESFIKELDYVALKDDKIIGSIVYSRMFFGTDKKMCEDIICFGPISIHPEYQKSGIGKKLINYTMAKAKELGFKAVLITGDTNYYNKFGFECASKYKILLPGMSEEDEAEFFMVRELEDGYLKNMCGIYDFDSYFYIGNDELESFEKNFPSKIKIEPRSTDLM